MSIYRTLIAFVAAMGLATSVFAADDNSSTQNSSDTNQVMQVADASTSTDQTATTTETKVDLNKATMKELMKVKGINRMKAHEILSYRKQHGDFKSLNDLKMVKGFKKMKDTQMKMIQDQLTIE